MVPLVETLQDPSRYTWAQLELALTVATLLRRGVFVLTELPTELPEDDEEDGA